MISDYRCTRKYEIQFLLSPHWQVAFAATNVQCFGRFVKHLSFCSKTHTRSSFLLKVFVNMTENVLKAGACAAPDDQRWLITLSKAQAQPFKSCKRRQRFAGRR